MTTIFIRVIIIYVFLVSIMRLMGKRQLGELEVSELVSALLLSDIAALPIGNQEIPLSYAIVPIIAITAFEVGVSFLLIKLPKAKNLISSRPAILINKGKIDKKEMMNNRISIDELISELRQRNVTDISEVEYAIIEQNGKMTIIQKAEYLQPTCKQLNLKPQESGTGHILISYGRFDKHGLKSTGKTKEWVNNILKSKSLTVQEVFLMTIDDSGKLNIIKERDTSK